MSATMTALAASTVFEQRFDSLTLRLTCLAKKTAGSSWGRELAEVVEEMRRLRRDLAGMEAVDLAPVVAVPSQLNLVRGNARRHQAKNRPGERRCGRHNGGEGAWLPIAAFDVKDKRTGQLKTWCRDCYKDYQRERYVKVRYQVVVVELHDGDACIGQDCPVCRKPFRPGQRIQGEDLVHEACLGPEPEAVG